MAAGKKDKNLRSYKERILVVDDEKMIRWSLGEALRGWGFMPAEAATAAEAVTAFEAESPAAVLLDINLPDGSGLDVLRKLRQREAAGGPAATPSSFNVSSTSGKTEGRALTLKKIDEIEEQMSQQWWKARGPRSESDAEGATAEGGHMAAQHARAYADTVPGVPQGGVPGSGQSPAHDGCVEEASIRFAHGDDAGAEAILLQALAPDSPTNEHDDTWRALLDLYRATGDD